MIRPGSQDDLADFSALVTARAVALSEHLPEPAGTLVGDLAGRPGKLLRPLLVRACAGFGVPDPGRLVALGTVVELLHLASLLHDDMIDRASVRRGGPAAHTVAGQEFATLAGLACFALAGTQAAELGRGVDLLVAQAVAGLSYGQMLDVERAFDTGLGLPDYLELAERKTADLFRLSCLLGAADAGVDHETTQALGAFGLNLGVAFQILDDCLDLADCDSGKPSGTDHLLGLFGAPTIYALAADATGELKSLLLSPAFGPEDMPAVHALVVAHDGVKAAARLARERRELAFSFLGGMPENGRGTLMAVAASAWRDPP
jgi:heptaprenyl diphosphate synthase